MRSELTSLDFSASFNCRRVQICVCSSWICSMLRPHNWQRFHLVFVFLFGFRMFLYVFGAFLRCNILKHKKLHPPDLCIWAAGIASRSQGPWQATCGAQHVAMTFLFATGEWPWKPGVSWAVEAILNWTTTNLPYCIIIITIIMLHIVFDACKSS